MASNDYYDNYPDYDSQKEEDEESEVGTRYTWEVLSWIVVAFTIFLNLLLIAILLIRRNAFNVVNKAILTIGIVDLIYGCFVSPFFVENYVHMHWNQSKAYCKMFEYIFTFHDLFVPMVLVLLSIYVSLKYSGATEAFQLKKSMYILCFVVCLVLSIFLAIPATHHATIFYDNPPEGEGQYKQECRTMDSFTMVITYSIFSFSLFCFTMSFAFSLCIVGSPLFRDCFDDREEYSYRWRTLLCLSLVNGLYMMTGFLLNFKELSRMFASCCEFWEPYKSLDNVTYDVFSFLLLLSEPFWRPIVYFAFYWKYLMDDIMEY